MKVNYKQLYFQLKQQEKALLSKLHPVDEVKANELPEDFNQNGWQLTVEKLEQLTAKLNELQQLKGNRLTPPFYKSIYNRALIGINEANKLIEKLLTESTDLNYEEEVQKLTVTIVELQKEVDGQLKLDIQE